MLQKHPVRKATVTDIDRTLKQTRKVYDSEAGRLVREVPAHEGEANAVQVTENVIVYTENGRKIMKDLATGLAEQFDPGLGGRLKTRMTLNFWRARYQLGNLGVGRFMNVPLNRSEGLTASQLKNAHAFQEALGGGNRGLDPRIQKDPEQSHFGNRYLFITQFGNTEPFKYNNDAHNASLKNLGIEFDGRMKVKNTAIVTAVGDWLNANPHVMGRPAYNQLQAHLHHLYPHKVEQPGKENSAT